MPHHPSTLVESGGRLRIVYKDVAGEISERVVDVERVWTTGTGERVASGYCHRRDEYRTFAVDRVLGAMPDDSTVVTTFAQQKLIPFPGRAR